MGNYASKDGTDDSSNIHDSIPSRNAGGGSNNVRSFRAEEQTLRATDEQALVLEGDMDNSVPTVFKWEHGGRNVYITGTFNNWERQIPMHRSGNDFSYVHNLKRGKHAFKFIVDDEWRFAPDQPTVADIEGRINNFIDVSDFAPYRKFGRSWCNHNYHFPFNLIRAFLTVICFIYQLVMIAFSWRAKVRDFVCPVSICLLLTWLHCTCEGLDVFLFVKRAHMKLCM